MAKYKIFAPGLALALALSLAPPAQAEGRRAPTNIRLSSPASTVTEVNSPSVARAVVKSKFKKRAVKLQQLTPGQKWTTVKNVKSNSKGKIQAKLGHPTAGTFIYRWKVMRNTKAKAAISKTFTYKVNAKPVDPPVDPPVDENSNFSFVVIGDTQSEVLSDKGTERFINRTKWIANNKQNEDIRFVVSTGDFSNWGWLDQSQYARGNKALDVLDQNNIDYAVTQGNHDTRAVGWNGVEGSRAYGGAAYSNNPECVERFSPAECKSGLLVRKSEEFNQNFAPSDFGALAGMYQPGKVENSYSTIEVENTKWLFLNLELWARQDALNWAKNVISTHQDYNVVIQTHSYLEGNGSIGQNNGGYGATSPQYLFNEIVSQYPNVKMVFSGHTGSLNNRTDIINNNKVASYLGNEASGAAATRIVTVYPEKGVVETRAYIGTNVDYSGAATATTRDENFSFIK